MNFIIIVLLLVLIAAFATGMYYFHHWIYKHDKDVITNAVKEYLKSEEVNSIYREQIRLTSLDEDLATDVLYNICQNESIASAVRSTALKEARKIIDHRKHMIEETVIKGFKEIDDKKELYDKRILEHQNEMNYLSSFYQKTKDGKLNIDPSVRIPYVSVSENAAGTKTTRQEYVSLNEIMESFIIVDDFMKEYELGLVGRAS